ncbi:MAG: 50S ribosomal protein L22 [Thermoguttaceae bacterium]|jgi:large subunit ribosomal protein L22
MAYEAVHRFARISARKVRPLADLVRGKLAEDALDILRYMPHRGARMLEKVIRSALANAEDRRASNLHHLFVVDVRVDGGPMFKRMQPKSRGMASIIHRRMSHIRVALDALE